MSFSNSGAGCKGKRFVGGWSVWILTDIVNSFRLRHPERSRSSGEERDLARSDTVMRARSRRRLVKTRAFGITHARKKFNLTHCRFVSQRRC